MSWLRWLFVESDRRTVTVYGVVAFALLAGVAGIGGDLVVGAVLALVLFVLAGWIATGEGPFDDRDAATWILVAGLFAYGAKTESILIVVLVATAVYFVSWVTGPRGPWGERESAE
ncbi:hypothetical protein [Halospeciosus flavus]|uniref:Phosphatidate cytidylyltransferase n=1 Tax=Halospeciosus flavus TaxID=3032283 RepID=A0ABD5Z2L9_9EURY|nr:hypothetical protein [Halospeciosus flavus]